MDSKLTGIIYNEEIYNLDGKNADQDLIVVVNKTDASHKDLLNKILTSIGHSSESAEIITSDNELDISDLNSKTLMSFGVPIKGKDLGKFSTSEDGNQLIIYSESLEAISGDSTNELKKKLWSLLKTYFKG